MRQCMPALTRLRVKRALTEENTVANGKRAGLKLAIEGIRPAVGVNADTTEIVSELLAHAIPHRRGKRLAPLARVFDFRRNILPKIALFIGDCLALNRRIQNTLHNLISKAPLQRQNIFWTGTGWRFHSLIYPIQLGRLIRIVTIFMLSLLLSFGRIFLNRSLPRFFRHAYIPLSFDLQILLVDQSTHFL